MQPLSLSNLGSPPMQGVPSPTQGRRPLDPNKARHYWGKRSASGPTTGKFGVPTHVDAMGREYRAAVPETFNQSQRRREPRGPKGTEWYCRVVGRKQGDPKGHLSRSGGPMNPRWPELGERLALFRLRDQRLGRAIVDQVWAMPRGVTARIVFQRPLRYDPRPVTNPDRYKQWIAKKSRGQRKRARNRGRRYSTRRRGLPLSPVPAPLATPTTIAASLPPPPAEDAATRGVLSLVPDRALRNRATVGRIGPPKSVDKDRFGPLLIGPDEDERDDDEGDDV